MRNIIIVNYSTARCLRVYFPSLQPGNGLSIHIGNYFHPYYIPITICTILSHKCDALRYLLNSVRMLH